MLDDRGPAARLAADAPAGGEPAEAVATLRGLASSGRLAAAAAGAPATRRADLAGAAYAVAWPVVFTRLTRPIELRRGHPACASSVRLLAEDCLDRFEDDVEAVVEDVLTHATKPIRNLEAWIASRLTAATVDGHRRQRGRRGALQRPRLPRWLAEALGGDPWLADLAIQVLVWVGLPGTAGTGLWPLDSWAQRRAAVTGDWAGSEPSAVEREVETVLAAMRTHGSWYADHVERPLGYKHPPVVSPFPGPDGHCPEPVPLRLAAEHEVDDAHLVGLATDAVAAIADRLGRGEDPYRVVVDVIGTVFGGYHGDPDIDRPPHGGTGYDDRLDALLRDPGELRRIVADVLRVVGGFGVGFGARSA